MIEIQVGSSILYGQFKFLVFNQKGRSGVLGMSYVIFREDRGYRCYYRFVSVVVQGLRFYRDLFLFSLRGSGVIRGGRFLFRVYGTLFKGILIGEFFLCCQRDFKRFYLFWVIYALVVYACVTVRSCGVGIFVFYGVVGFRRSSFIFVLGNDS